MQKSKFQTKNSNSSKQFICTASANPANGQAVSLTCHEIDGSTRSLEIVSAPRRIAPKAIQPKLVQVRRGHSKSESSDASCESHRSNQCDGASLTTGIVVDDAIFQNELGNSSAPPDTIMAIGPTVAIAMVNRLIGYFQRPSLTRVNLETMTTFLPFGSRGGGGDVQIIYDEFSSRFFALAWVNQTVSATLTITSPASVAGVYNARKFVNSAASVFPITDEIVPVDPIDAYNPVTGLAGLTPASLAAINGKIALVKRRSLTFPTIPGGVVSVATLLRNAGATGYILYNDQEQPIPNFGGLVSTPSFPQIAISKEDGELLASAYGAYPPFLPASPLVGTMAAIPSVIQNYMNIAVSKTSAPLSTNDWYNYQLTTDYWLTANLAADYPKIAVDEQNFYITTNDYSFNASGLIMNSDGVVTVLKKADLVKNTTPTFIDDSSSTFVSQSLFENNFIPQPARIVYSCYKDYLPPFFLALADYAANEYNNRSTAAGLRVFIGSSLDAFVDVPFPVPTQIDAGAVALQPLSSTGASSIPLDALHFVVMTAVIWKTSIFVAHTIVSGTKSIVRWYELDVSKAASYGSVKIKQWGDIDTCVPDESTFTPAINIDKCGNMGITFTISGPNTLPTFAYTGRLKNDPPGTVRKPFQIIKTSPYPYNGAVQSIVFTTGNVLQNRWEDYKGLVIDPNDHKTFYAFGQNSADNQPPAVATDVDARGRSLKWTTVIGSFTIDKSCTDETWPAEPCPIQPAVTIQPRLKRLDQKLPDDVVIHVNPNKRIYDH